MQVPFTSLPEWHNFFTKNAYVVLSTKESSETPFGEIAQCTKLCLGWTDGDVGPKMMLMGAQYLFTHEQNAQW